MDHLSDWLQLNKAPRIGPKLFHAILADAGSPMVFLHEKRWRSNTVKLPKAAVAYLESLNPDLISADLQWCEHDHNHIITYHDAQYPLLLKEIANPPPLLYVRGDPSALQQVQLAIVGTRNPTPIGEQNAHEFAFHLAQQGMVITSGLAIGIDGLCHQAALAAQGVTVAVMGTGLNRVYPSRHHQLAHQIEDSGGALVSEFPLDTPPKPQLFPRRNRIISGLSIGALVVEATVKSGSLITARLALEQGREVFAIPGSIHNAQAKGCHLLIKQGAKLVETAQDILEELGAIAIASQTTATPVETAPAQTAEAEAEDNAQYRLLLETLSSDAMPIDWLAERTGFSVSALSTMLLMLELEGKIQALPGGLYCRINLKNTPQNIY